ncbi:unnamed protein product [Heterobilharzia americana]|nr:unnamed protein product [Heterobilharzia americana]
MKHRLMADISTDINSLLVKSKQSTNSISEVLRSLLQYLNSDAVYCSMIFPLTRELENAHCELTDTLHNLLPEPILKQIAKYKHLEPQLKEWESSAHRVNRHKRNLDQSCNRSRSTIKVENAHNNFRASSMSHDYLTNYLLDAMNTIENEGTMACCDALFVLVSAYKQFSDRIYSVLNCLFEEVNKLHECAARALNESHSKSLMSMENATNATKWRASSIMTTDKDCGGSLKYRSASTGRMMPRNYYPCDHFPAQIINVPSEFETNGEILKMLKNKKLSHETIGSSRSHRRSSSISKETLPAPPPTRTASASIRSTESLIQDSDDKTICNASSASVILSDGMVDTQSNSNKEFDKVTPSNTISNKKTNDNTVTNDTTDTDGSGNSNTDNKFIRKNRIEQLTSAENSLFNPISPTFTSYSTSQFTCYSHDQQQQQQLHPYYQHNHNKEIPHISSCSVENDKYITVSCSKYMDKAEMTLPITTVPHFSSKNHTIKKQIVNNFDTDENESTRFCSMKSHNTSNYIHESNEDNCFIPILIHRNSSTSTNLVNDTTDNQDKSSHIGDNDSNIHNSYINSPRDVIFLDDKEIRSSKQSIALWGCLPSPITEEEDE